MTQRKRIEISPEKLKQIYAGKQGAQLILCLGFPSTGKSAALRSLDPKSTYVINVLGKRLPYIESAKLEADHQGDGRKGNICTEKSYFKILSLLRSISTRRPEVSTVIIDDGTYIMSQEFVDTAKERGYEKFTNMASHLWAVLRAPVELRPDLKVIFSGHVEDDNGMWIMQTVGKMTREKLRPEGLTDLILISGVERIGDEGDVRYFFYTQSNSIHMARSPMDMFPYRIPNDMRLVCDRIDEYNQGVSLRDSELDFTINTYSPARPVVVK